MKAVIEAYRVTNAKILENKIRIMLIDIYIKRQIINAHRKDKLRVDSVVIDICRQICDYLKRKEDKNRLANITPQQAKLEWSKKILANHQLNPHLNKQQHKNFNSIVIQQYQEKVRKKMRRVSKELY